MGISTLVGQADGTTDAAAMYDNTTGWMVGAIWEAPDAADQIEAFLQWLSAGGAVKASADGELVFSPNFAGPRDPRGFSEVDLAVIIKYWRATFIGDDGWLLDPFECACGKGHTHMGENGETARYGECVYSTHDPACACTSWTPGNRAAAAAAEGA